MNSKKDAEYHNPDVLNFVKRYGHLPSLHCLDFYNELEKDDEGDYPLLYDPEDPAGWSGRSD